MIQAGLTPFPTGARRASGAAGAGRAWRPVVRSAARAGRGRHPCLDQPDDQRSGHLERQPAPDRGAGPHWDPRMIWWGPAGIGATMTIDRYAQQHSAPFRAAFTDRTGTGTWRGWRKGRLAGSSAGPISGRVTWAGSSIWPSATSRWNSAWSISIAGPGQADRELGFHRPAACAAPAGPRPFAGPDRRLTGCPAPGAPPGMSDGCSRLIRARTCAAAVSGARRKAAGPLSCRTRRVTGRVRVPGQQQAAMSFLYTTLGPLPQDRLGLILPHEACLRRSAHTGPAGLCPG